MADNLEKIEKDIHELCEDCDIRLIDRESKETYFDIPLEEFLDVMAKKSAQIVMKKFFDR